MQESGGPGFKTRGLQSVLRRTCSYQGHHMESLYSTTTFIELINESSVAEMELSKCRAYLAETEPEVHGANLLV